jgi:hypothetical protein
MKRIESDPPDQSGVTPKRPKILIEVILSLDFLPIAEANWIVCEAFRTGIA